MSAHTPGPWTINPKSATHVIGPGERGIASTDGARSNQADEYEVNLANALLIAAAPEMLSLLEEIKKRVNRAYKYALSARSGDYDCEFAHIHKLMANSTVIAQATGEVPA